MFIHNVIVMKINNRNCWLILISTCLFISCRNDHSIKKDDVTIISVIQDDIDSVKVKTLPFYKNTDSRLSPSIGIIAVKKGLIINPFSNQGNKMASFFINHYESDCCVHLSPLILNGRGPGELSIVSAAGKSVNSDTVTFYSANDAKFLIFDEELSLVEEAKMFEPLNIRGDLIFRNYASLVSINPKYNDENIFRQINHENKSSYSFYPARVPVDYEPQIRNKISSLTPTPDGFAFSFTGDKEVLFLSKDNNTISRLQFGSNDPIETWKANSTNDGARSMAYIREIEYHNDNLFVLYDNEVIVFSYPKLEPNKRFVFEQATNPLNRKYVTDFSVVDDMMYIVYNSIEVMQIKSISELIK